MESKVGTFQGDQVLFRRHVCNGARCLCRAATVYMSRPLCDVDRVPFLTVRLSIYTCLPVRVFH